MLPESKHVLDEVNGELRISEDFLKFDQNWGHYLGRAQEDIAEGRNDPIWLEQAAAASELRAAGEFDDWKDNEYELFWGVKQKLPSNVLTGQATFIKFDDLITRELIKPSDTFLFQRTVGGFFIEKEIKVNHTNRLSSDEPTNETLVYGNPRLGKQEVPKMHCSTRNLEVLKRR
jgi:hypothetical protein